MARTHGSTNLLAIKRGAILRHNKANNSSNYKLAKEFNCDEKTVRNIKINANSAEKENINLLSLEVY